MFNQVFTSSYGKEQIVNENFLLQEAYNRGVIDRTLKDPPTEPSSNGFYIPALPATGAWENKENQLMWWNSAGYWRAIAPSDGMKLNSQAENNFIQYNSSNNSWSVLSNSGTTNQVFPPVATEADLAGIEGAIAADFVKVTDADGNGNEAWYIYDGQDWQKLVLAGEESSSF